MSGGAGGLRRLREAIRDSAGTIAALEAQVARIDAVSREVVSVLRRGRKVLTCIGNDFGFDRIFSRQVEGLGRRGDVLVLFSTSGKAANLQRAVDAARGRGVKVVCMLGRDGGALAGRGDLEIVVPGSATERIQEAHQVIIHLILDAVEAAFLPAGRGSGRRGSNAAGKVRS